MALAGCRRRCGPSRERTPAGPALLVVLVALVAFWLSGCETTKPNAVPGASRDLLAFLDVGLTTSDDVLQRLGRPSGSFERGAILTYRIGEAQPDVFFVVKARLGERWSVSRYSLVLMFDAEGVLKKKNLVRVKDLEAEKDLTWEKDSPD